MLQFFFKVAVFIWPFLKEMFLGDKTIKEAVKSNKIRVTVISVIFLSVALNIFTVPRLISITQLHLDLLKKYQMVHRENEELKKKKPPVVTVRPESIPVPPPPEPAARRKPPAIKPSSKTHPPASNPVINVRPDDEEEERLRKVREKLEQIQNNENAHRRQEHAK